jgi:hypothetical protein
MCHATRRMMGLARNGSASFGIEPIVPYRRGPPPVAGARIGPRARVAGCGL